MTLQRTLLSVAARAVIISALGAVQLATAAPTAGAQPFRRDANTTFDFSVTNAPAAQVFAMLASDTRMNVLVPADLTGNISIDLKGVTLQEALEAIRDNHGYGFTVSGNRVQIHSNAVQTRVFQINHLSVHRRGTSDTRVLSGSLSQQIANNASTSAGGSGSGTPQQSTTTVVDDSTRVSTSNDADFWRDTREAIESIVAASGSDDAKGGQKRSVSISPAAGLVVVRARPEQLKAVEEYLKRVHANVQRQVMLEAKIVNVQLTRQASSGVNWAYFRASKDGARISGGGAIAPGTVFAPGAGRITSTAVSLANAADGAWSAVTGAANGFYGLAFSGATFSAVLDFLESQGDVQVLSSPRIATQNAQKALLKVGTDEFFVTDVTTNSTSNGSSTTVVPSVKMTPFFSGIALDVTPQIDDDGSITLHIHPSISKVTERNKVISIGTGTYSFPSAVSNVNETDSVVRLRDGEIAAIGGLMTVESSDDNNGVQGLKDVPVLGNLFSQQSKTGTKRELVILVKPTIIDPTKPAPAPVVPDVAFPK